MNRILVGLLFISLTHANSLSGFIYSTLDSSPIEAAILLATYSAGNDNITVTGISGPDGNYWIPCMGSVYIEIIAEGYDTLVTNMEVSGDSLHNFYMNERENQLSVNPNVEIPNQLILHHNYPNPFNPVTTLRYDLPENAIVSITIYDKMGRIVKTMVNDDQTAGYKSIQWNATNDAGQPVSAGLYLYRIYAGEFVQTKKMVLLK
ncbi:uncharacterized protein METZ01_LOCUS121825 [marine metagenome]|uniref:FlgD/Vpr Ig-like domain-containing protein n=1 Tax=marine metagenome TaxID=408172 RepID=A0A381XX20_9ZZZZ